MHAETPESTRPPLDVHRRVDPLLSWKDRLGYVALVLTLIGLGASYALTGRTDFHAERAPVAAVHQAVEANCQACHVDFTPINSRSWHAPFLGDPLQTSQRCETCHAGPPHHVGAQPEQSCGACHREHRGRDASLVNLPASDCTQCHRDLPQHSVKPTAFQPDVTRFSAAEHPTFRSLRNDPGTIRFNHRLHMAAGMALGKGGGELQTLGKIPEQARERYRAQQDRKEDDAPVQLQCASCHQPNQAGTYMKPITYENQCQACHPLTLGKLTLPHRWQPKELHGLLENYFTDQVARGDAKLLDQKIVRPLPGKLPNLLPISAREMIAKEVLFAEKDLYTGQRLCAECHTFTGKSIAEALKQGNAPQLQIAPSRIPNVWLRHAKFSHKSHRAQQCSDCHTAATTSVTHTDVLIPDRDHCVKCHAPTTSAGTAGARFNCTECHLYHNGDHRLNGIAK
jgi:hypothetical protein